MRISLGSLVCRARQLASRRADSERRDPAHKRMHVTNTSPSEVSGDSSGTWHTASLRVSAILHGRRTGPRAIPAYPPATPADHYSWCARGPGRGGARRQPTPRPLRGSDDDLVSAVRTRSSQPRLHVLSSKIRPSPRRRWPRSASQCLRRVSSGAPSLSNRCPGPT